MAKYTVELRDIVKSGYNIFNFPYDFVNEESKKSFEEKFIIHFKYREICCETVGRWQDYLHDKFNITLPYYVMLMNTALIDYEKTINYNLTETLSRKADKTDVLSGTSTLNGNTSNNTTNNNTLVHTLDGTTNGERTNVLSSVSDHTEATHGITTDTITEENTTDKTITVETDNLKVESDTPKNLLSVNDLKTNVYASKADREDNEAKTTDKTTVEATKNGTTNDDTSKTAKDSVNATNTDKSLDKRNEETKDTNNGTSYESGTYGNSATSNQNASGLENENYTKIMKGSYGVITEADMLQKHIALQQKLTTILSSFFDDCEDLFMGVY